jgi:hypothetical protein
LHVQQNHRLQAQITQRHLLELGKAMIRRQQRIRPLRRHQRFGLDGGVEVVFIQNRQVEGARGQALHQLLLFAVADADFHPRIQRREPGNQLRQVQRRDRFEATDIDLPGHHVVVGEGVLFELLGHAQQFLGLAVEACAAGGQGHALGVMTDQQLHAEAVLQAFDRRGDRRLGDVQLARGLGDAAAFDGGDEVLQLTQVVGSHGKPRGGWTRHPGNFCADCVRSDDGVVMPEQ